MPKMTVIHRCGHDQDHSLTGSVKQINEKAKKLAEQPCSKCLKQADIRNYESVIADMNLPSLRGTDKQVPWAAKIRKEIAAQVLSWPGSDNVRDKIAAAFASETSAKWWIDHRNSPRAAYKELSRRVTERPG